jgi:hypothetical protein
MRQPHRAGHVEAELIAPEDRFVPAVLREFMWYGIEQIVAEILVDAAVPLQFGPVLRAAGGLSGRMPRSPVRTLNSSAAGWRVRGPRGGAQYDCDSCMEKSAQ